MIIRCRSDAEIGGTGTRRLPRARSGEQIPVYCISVPCDTFSTNTLWCEDEIYLKCESSEKIARTIASRRPMGLSGRVESHFICGTGLRLKPCRKNRPLSTGWWGRYRTLLFCPTFLHYSTFPLLYDSSFFPASAVKVTSVCGWQLQSSLYIYYSCCVFPFVIVSNARPHKPPMLNAESLFLTHLAPSNRSVQTKDGLSADLGDNEWLLGHPESRIKGQLESDWVWEH